MTPKGLGRWGDRVARMPFFSFNIGGVIFAVNVYFCSNTQIRLWRRIRWLQKVVVAITGTDLRVLNGTGKRFCFFERVGVEVELEGQPHVRELLQAVKRLRGHVVREFEEGARRGHEEALPRGADALPEATLDAGNRLHKKTLLGVQLYVGELAHLLLDPRAAASFGPVRGLVMGVAAAGPQALPDQPMHRSEEQAVGRRLWVVSEERCHDVQRPYNEG